LKNGGHGSAPLRPDATSETLCGRYNLYRQDTTQKLRGNTVAVEKEEFDLQIQLGQLAQQYFPRMTKVPTLTIQRLCDKEYQDAPAWLNARSGKLYIDERVYTFQEKMTKILILHELIHYQLYLDKHPNPGDENSNEFQSELARLKGKGAYTGLL
jgi:hypothetical protein